MFSEVGQSWFRSWKVSGDEHLTMVYSMANIEIPSDVVFDSRDLADYRVNVMTKEVTDTQTRDVRKLIERGLVEGLSIDEIAGQLEASKLWDPYRARTIARTEATRSVNGAAVEAYKVAEKYGLTVNKQWLSSRDDKVRPSHQELDATAAIDSNSYFETTFESAIVQADSPGTFGIAGMDINCRCTVLPVVL